MLSIDDDAFILMTLDSVILHTVKGSLMKFVTSIYQPFSAGFYRNSSKKPPFLLFEFFLN